MHQNSKDPFHNHLRQKTKQKTGLFQIQKFLIRVRDILSNIEVEATCTVKRRKIKWRHLMKKLLTSNCLDKENRKSLRICSRKTKELMRILRGQEALKTLEKSLEIRKDKLKKKRKRLHCYKPSGASIFTSPDSYDQGIHTPPTFPVLSYQHLW